MNTLHPATPATAVEAAAVQAMQSAQGTLDVWPDCCHTVTLAEAAVVASPPFQRLRRLRQMGLAFHAWPNAENTRASHSAGVSYWAATYLAALDRCPHGATQSVLARTRAALAPLSLDVVLRLFALLHDIDLLPLGHTLRYQSGAFAEGRGRPRLVACVAAIKANARDEAFRDALSATDRERLLTAFEAHLDAAADALADHATSFGQLLNELVNSGLGADLMDFALRDSAAINRKQARHDALAEHLRLAESAGQARLMLELGEPSEAPARVDAVDDLYRARFEIFAASVFHPVKLAGDAMLDFALRRVGPARCAELLPQDRLLQIGDDELIDTIVAADEATTTFEPCVQVARRLRQGQLHEEVWRTEDLARFSRHAGAERALALAPGWRSAVERRLRERLAWAADGDLIVAVSAPTMQVKPADALLCAGDETFTLAEANEHGFSVAAPRIARQYAALWSLRLYLSSRCRGHRESVRATARDIFDDHGAVR